MKTYENLARIWPEASPAFSGTPPWPHSSVLPYLRAATRPTQTDQKPQSFLRASSSAGTIGDERVITSATLPGRRDAIAAAARCGAPRPASSGAACPQASEPLEQLIYLVDLRLHVLEGVVPLVLTSTRRRSVRSEGADGRGAHRLFGLIKGDALVVHVAGIARTDLVPLERRLHSRHGSAPRVRACAAHPDTTDPHHACA